MRVGYLKRRSKFSYGVKRQQIEGSKEGLSSVFGKLRQPIPLSPLYDPMIFPFLCPNTLGILQKSTLFIIFSISSKRLDFLVRHLYSLKKTG